MEFDFKNINAELTKMIFESDKIDHFVITGSFALYNIHFDTYKKDNILEIKIKDLDFDVNNFKNQNKDVIKETIKSYFNLELKKIFQKIGIYDNVADWNIEIINDKIEERMFNYGNYGIKVKIIIEDTYENEYKFNLDIGFETKTFEILTKKIKLFNSNYQIKIYTLEKMLADKYLAVFKRIKKINSTNMNIGQIKQNCWKLSKDLFDINFIHKQKIDKTKVKEYINQMLKKDKININKIFNIVNYLLTNNKEITLKRGMDSIFNNKTYKTTNFELINHKM